MEVVPHVQFDLSRVIHSRIGERFLASLKGKWGDAAKGARPWPMAAYSKAAVAWVSGRGLPKYDGTRALEENHGKVGAWVRNIQWTA